MKYERPKEMRNLRGLSKEIKRKKQKMNKELELPCYCWEGYKCDFCQIRKKAFRKMKKKYGVFNPKFEQNAEQFIKDAITITIQEFTHNSENTEVKK